MKISVRQSLLFAFMLITAGHVTAQDSLFFSLAEAKAYAMEHSYAIRNSSLDVAAAKKKVWETIATGLPQVSGSASYNDNITAGKTPFPVAIIPKDYWPVLGIPDDASVEDTYPISFAQKYSSDFGFQVDQLIFDGSYIVGIGSAKLYLQLTTQAREKNEIEIRHAVEQAYYGALIARENLSVLQENLTNSKKQFADTKAMFENGFVEEQDVEQLKLIVQNSENEIMKAEREIRIAEIVLKYTMGVDVNSTISLMDNLNEMIDPLLLHKEDTTIPDLTTHIDYRLSDSQRLSQIKLLKLEQSAFLPTISAFYSWNKSAYGDSWNLFKSDSPWYPSSMLGLNVSVPIFTSGNKAAKVKKARIELEKAENNQKQAVQTLQKDYLTAIADLETSVDQLKNNIDNKLLAKRIYNKTLIKYNNGIVSSTELSQTESQFIQAQASWVASVMQLFTAKINLDKAIGK
ncbi:TolC family protein [Mangrovibacterium sp.]|uniref:TolC family protein n=1 Tax=Mangrovibacterium sp. TaxID=1961364 RepID=UPI003561C5CC